MNGLTLLVLIAVAAGGFLLFRLGIRHAERQRPAPHPLSNPAAHTGPPPGERPAFGAPAAPERRVAEVDRRGARSAAISSTTHSPAATVTAAIASPTQPARAAAVATADPYADEYARLVRTLAGETFALRDDTVSLSRKASQLDVLAEDHHRLLRELADARSAAARYRQLVIDLENNAPPPLLTGAHALDDLKLVVGIGPMLERMLQQLGITTYRQIARWSERDIAEFDAKLPEFPGRIRRDEWVKQARALHQSKYGEVLSVRG